jgi:hypothetical protein
VTIAKRPSERRDGESHNSDLGRTGTEIFLPTGLDWWNRFDSNGEFFQNAISGEAWRRSWPLRKSAVESTYSVDWQLIPNRTNVWRTSLDLNGSEFAIYAVQTHLASKSIPAPALLRQWSCARLMSVWGHSRRHDGSPITSGLRRLADILSVGRHFGFVPGSDMRSNMHPRGLTRWMAGLQFRCTNLGSTVRLTFC